MYFYLFDSFLQDKKFKKEIREIENRISELGISGRSIHLSVLKNFNDSLKEAIDRKFETVVIVGNDLTINKTINFLADFPINLGIIPLGEPSNLAKFLGIPQGRLAVDILANRLIEKIDLGRVNKQYFLSSVQSQNGQFFLKCDGHYEIFFSPEQSFSINNLCLSCGRSSNPQDGLLETIILSHTQKLLSAKKQNINSIFYNKKINIKLLDQGSAPLLVDGVRILKTPAEVEIVPKKIKIVVGRERVF